MPTLTRTTHNSSGSGRCGAGNNGDEGGNPNIAAVITQQLQELLPTIVTQVSNNVNNRGNRNGGRNDDNNIGRYADRGNERDNPGNGNNNPDGNGCTYTEFMACKSNEFDSKGGALEYTRWVEKMESVIDINDCATYQRVKYVACSLTAYTDWFHELAKLVTYLDTLESKRIDRYIHGLVPEIHRMVRTTEPSTIQIIILKARALTDDVVRDEELSKSGDKKKVVSELSKQACIIVDNKKAKWEKGLAAINHVKKKYIVLEDIPFSIDLLHVELGSFDVVVGMD
ncbi:hypothetical protein Tco_0536404 [Tanacetum coccineum]